MAADGGVRAARAPGQLLTAGVLAVALTALAGCETAWQYNWGSYQRSIWQLYASPAGGGADVGKQIQELESEIRRTEAKAKASEASRVPPGKWAHLGYLYAMQGDQMNARRCLQAEKTVYPESAKFIDGLLARMP